MNLSIARRAIGPGHPVFVIAEAGVNHNGDVGMALELVRAAKRVGADAVKFQTFRAETLVTTSAPKAPYQIVSTGAGSQMDMLRRLQLDADAHAALQKCAANVGIAFFSTPYGTEDADFLDRLGVPAFKLASAQLVEDGFLAHVARKGRPIILSTGMATLPEVVHAVDVVRSAGLQELVVLQCTTHYPTAVDEANVRAMNSIAAACDVAVGYSDHTEDSVAAIAAVALGACVVEKHFTLDRTLPGPDQSSSFDPDQFGQFVESVRATEKALGNGYKVPAPSERENIVPMRRSVVALRAISKGTVLSRDMLGVKRPATGLPAARLEECVGRRAARDLQPDMALQEDSVEW